MGRTPEIRFKGFADDWEQRKLDDVAKFSKGNGYSKGDLIEAGTPIILYGRLYTGYETTISDVDTFVEAKDGSVYSKGGEVIVPASGETAEDIARAATVDKPGILLGGDLNVVMPNEEINSAFLAISISNGNSQRELAKKAQGKSVVHIHNEEIRNLVVPFPTKAEQSKIEDYFANLDNLITLHQRKCDETKKLKKYMLQKMFPRNGKSKPEIRFAGFTDDWEQRKLNEIADKVSEKNKNNEFSEPFTNSAEQGIISQKDYFDREIVNNENLDGYYIVRNDDFIYNPRISVTAPVGPINRNRLGRNGVMSPLYTVFRTHDIDNLYLEFYFKTTKWHCFMKINGDSGARFDRFTISSTQFMEMPIPYPTLEEQRKMGEYFDSLDHLITLHQRKLEKLQTIKKFMLGKMFV
ncbi:restriction endonuclease subunit S [Clostridium sp.]